MVACAAVELFRVPWGDKYYMTVLDGLTISALLLVMLVLQSVQDLAEVPKIKLRLVDHKTFLARRKKMAKSENAKQKALWRAKAKKYRKAMKNKQPQHELLVSDKNQQSDDTKLREDAKTGDDEIATANALPSEAPLAEESKERAKEEDSTEFKISLPEDKESQKRVRIKEGLSADDDKRVSQQSNARTHCRRVCRSQPECRAGVPIYE
eukprot:TRINITY_DN8248_c0_g1_i1.p1 TRINITY_DN8248_c0_g1~~TRINITY_DN8248_c0_g1_i1.p1  ORF type:complete len:209 (-),score=57.35 TRINITY_DN8248_c0_g1_i1:210-836(-)